MTQPFDKSTNEDTSIPDFFRYVYQNPRQSLQTAGQLAYEFSPLYATTAAREAKENFDKGNVALGTWKTAEGIMSVLPVLGRTISKPLGAAVKSSIKQKGNFGEDAYHYTKSRTPFERFDIDETVKRANEYSESWIDFLGTHVGTKKAAGQRGSSRIDDIVESGSFEAGVNANQNLGHSLPLSIDTSKPFKPSTVGFEFIDIDSLGVTPRWANFQKKAMEQDVWTEEALQDYIVNKVIGEDLNDLYQAREVPKEDILNIIADFRKKLAKEGHTNIPYINDYEDAGNISNVMLIDRAKSEPVIRSKLTGEPMAEGGLVSLTHVARDMFRGPQGISAFEQFIAKPQRPMVS
jgi:hypothetical protein